MHWTLDQVRDLSTEDFDELVSWSRDKANTDDSIDADAMIEARTSAKAGKGGEQDG